MAFLAFSALFLLAYRVMDVHVAQADITVFAVDAIVIPCSASAVNPGILSILAGKGGDEIAMELTAKAPLAIGAAMIAACPQLAAQHAVLVPIIKYPDDDVATELLRRAVKAALIAAKMKRYQTIALPPMVGQEGGSTLAEATRAVVQEIRTHNAEFPHKVYFVDSSESITQIFENAIKYSQHSL